MTHSVELAGDGHTRVFDTRWNNNEVYGHLNNTARYAAMDTTITSWLIETAGLRGTAGVTVLMVVL